MPNGYRKLILEWSDRPDRDAEWADRERKTNPEFEREYGLLWGSVVGTPVFRPIYKKALHEVEMVPLEKTEVMVGLDFGFTRPAMALAQFDGAGQLGIRRELLGEDETIDRFGLRVQRILRADFSGCPVAFYGDPSGHQRNDRSERTSIQILKDLYGWRVKTRPSEIIQGIDRIRLHLLARSDGKPGIVIDPVQCPKLAYGFARGYVRSENDPEKPLKDGFYDHLFDALRYMAIHVLKPPKRLRGKPSRMTPDEANTAAIWAGRRGRRKSENPVIGDW